MAEQSYQKLYHQLVGRDATEAESVRLQEKLIEHVQQAQKVKEGKPAGSGNLDEGINAIRETYHIGESAIEQVLRSFSAEVTAQEDAELQRSNKRRANLRSIGKKFLVGTLASTVLAATVGAGLAAYQLGDDAEMVRRGIMLDSREASLESNYQKLNQDLLTREQALAAKEEAILTEFYGPLDALTIRSEASNLTEMEKEVFLTKQLQESWLAAKSSGSITYSGEVAEGIEIMVFEIPESYTSLVKLQDGDITSVYIRNKKEELRYSVIFDGDSSLVVKHHAETVKKYQGDTLVFVGESSKRHDQIAADVWADYSALKSRGPSN